MAAQDPKTREEWQEAVDLAQGLLTFASARAYGLVAGGPEVNALRCDQILRRGEARGITPHDNAAELVVLALLEQQGAPR